MHMISFGEILFDVFPDTAVIGGAPLNVSAHFHALGGDSTIVSAVGNDELGKRALACVDSLGLTTHWIGDSEYPTGRADIVLTGKSADYTFNEPCAWDHIQLVHPLPPSCDVIYFGTLAQRSCESRQTLQAILDSVKATHVFYDVNIRKDFYTQEIILQGMQHATILKVNDEEFPLIKEIVRIEEQDEAKAAQALAKKFNLQTILITKGKAGTTLYHGDQVFHQQPQPVPVVDTVGAGDSLSAGFLATYLKSGNLKQALYVGSALADYVVGHQGAIPEYDDTLREFLGT